MKSLYLLFFLVLSVNCKKVCRNVACSPVRLYADIVSIIDSSSSMGDGLFDGVKEFLTDIATNVTIGSGEDNTQMAFYTFSKTGRSYGSLNSGSNKESVLNTINGLNFDNYGDRDINEAFNLEEDEVNTGNGLRSQAKKILLIFSSNSFTGTIPSQNGILGKLQQKYDHLISIGLGINGPKNNFDELLNIASDASQLFFAPSSDQLPFIYPAVLQHGCSNYKPTATTPKPTPLPTQSPSASCQVSTLSYDIYLLVDNSANLDSSTFSNIKNQLYTFISPYSIGKLTDVAVFGISLSTQEYYTSFENSQVSDYVTSAIRNLVQDPNNGQATSLTLSLIKNTLLKKAGSNGKSQLIIYVTDNTNYDSDPSYILSTLNNQYGVKTLVVRTGTSADINKVTKFAGTSNCVYDVPSKGVSGIGGWLQEATCRKNFCV